MTTLEITLSYRGNRAEQHELDLYDAGQALIGFQRSLALTTHLILNDEIITQAPSLKGAEIFARPPDRGSWELVAIIAVAVATAAYKLGTAPKDTPIGHLIRSAYDYVISEICGFHVDYDKTLGQQYSELSGHDDAVKVLSEPRFDSLIEKCEVAVREMHRPIVKSRTAIEGTLTARTDDVEYMFEHTLTQETYNYVAFTERSSSAIHLTGRVTSYNMNTYKGRIYVADYGRPVPFELSEFARDPQSVITVAESLSANVQRRGGGEISFNAFSNLSRTGRLKSLFIIEVLSNL